MSTNLNLIVIVTIHLMSVLVKIKGDESYQDVKALEDNIFSSASYSPTLRPLKNQTQVLNVNVQFSLVAIVALDDVRQEMITNGFVFLFWDDEISHWNASDYGGFERLAPNPKQMWRPRLAIINTLGDRDPFEDDYSHTFFGNNGDMGWVPGSLFHTYCALDMKKFPFDVQTCKIQMSPMGLNTKSLQFVANEDMNLAFFYPNPGWDLLETKVTVENVDVVPSETFSCPTFTFKMKRRSANIVLNVILPVIFLSVLNNLVFFIPGESGEKISYAITVLLSLSVFLSMVSTMTPQISDSVPALTVYLFVLLLSSVLTVAAAIFTVYLQHKEEEEDASIQTRSDRPVSSDSVHKITAVAPDKQAWDIRDNSSGDRPRNSGYNKYRLISKHIDKFFFVLVTCLWLISTVWYFVFANLS